MSPSQAGDGRDRRFSHASRHSRRRRDPGGDRPPARFPARRMADRAGPVRHLQPRQHGRDLPQCGGLRRRCRADRCNDCCDPLYRKAVRVSVGGVLRVPFYRYGGLAEASRAPCRKGLWHRRPVACRHGGDGGMDAATAPGAGARQRRTWPAARMAEPAAKRCRSGWRMVSTASMSRHRRRSRCSACNRRASSA